MNMTVRALRKSLLIVLLTLGPGARAQEVVLGGTIVTPDKVIPKGWIVVKAGHIDSIMDKSPAGSIVETGGIIFPGFVDLHNHPMYNIFKRWAPKAKFNNRYEWRDLQEYKDLIGTPDGELQRAGDQTFCDIDEYVEIKELIGGTTSITGISGRFGINPPVPSCVAGLARDLDWASGFYGSSVGNERVENLLGVTPRDLRGPALQKILDELAGKKLDLLLVHVAEGSPVDTESSLEFRALRGVGLLGEHTAIIHGVALASDDLQQMRVAGTALIWSPRSNTELYGHTANIAEAFRQGVTVALAPDWSPTGSTNMLAELRFANRLDHDEMFGLLSDRELFEMATAIPARIARVDDKIGSLRPGLFADLFVVSGDGSRPFAALAQARPEDVQLVLVGGVAIYGSEKLLNQFQIPTEAVDVCGARMLLNTAALPAGKFADVTDRLKSDLKKYKIGLAPLVECEH